MTKRIEEHGGDVAAGITQAAREIAAEITLYSLNMLLTTPTDVWALRYPDTNELWVLERSIAALGGPAAAAPTATASISARRRGSRACSPGSSRSGPRPMIASQPMDTNPLWRLLEPGELIHVDPELRVTSTIAVPDPPASMLELTAKEEAAQQEDAAQGAGA